MHWVTVPRLHGLQESDEMDAAAAVVRLSGQTIQALEPLDSLYEPTGQGRQAATGFPATDAEP